MPIYMIMCGQGNSVVPSNRALVNHLYVYMLYFPNRALTVC